MNTIIRLTPETFPSYTESLAEVLHACVHAGASVSFVLPFSHAEARAFWLEKVAPGLEQGSRILWVAQRGGRAIGTVQLDLETPPNQPHRAGVAKLLVHPDFRQQGIARRLMLMLETEARSLGRSLLTLDTRSGDSAEPLYLSMGYERAGIIPGYALAVDGATLDSTTIMFKPLAA